MKTICTLLVDDNTDFLDAAERMLGAMEAVCVVGRANSGDEALNEVQRLQPDLVLMDWAMPRMSGLEATRLMKSRRLPPCVVLVTVHDALPYRRAAQDAGADGFVTKGDWDALWPLLQRLFFEKTASGTTMLAATGEP